MTGARPELRLASTVRGTPDPQALAGFYERLLGWPRVSDEPGWVKLQSPDGGSGLSFQHEEHFERPVWPGEAGRPQMTAHLDIAVDDLDAAAEWAVAAGAEPAAVQPATGVRVMLDPDGHPFCLFTNEA